MLSIGKGGMMAILEETGYIKVSVHGHHKPLTKDGDYIEK
jgi:hypothetical protein